MSLGFDLKQALDCARVMLTLYGPQTPPRRLLDHVAHLEHLARGSVHGTEFDTAPAELGHDLIGTDEAASIIGCTPRYVRRIHADLDGQQIGGRWVFERKVVEEYASARQEHRRRAG